MVHSLLLLVATGCINADPQYCCTYETRISGCAERNWGDWVVGDREFVQSELDEDGQTAQQACDDFTETFENCEAVCCLTTQYREVVLFEEACE